MLPRTDFFTSWLLALTAAALLTACHAKDDKPLDDNDNDVPEGADLAGIGSFDGGTSSDMAGGSTDMTGAMACRGRNAPGTYYMQATNTIRLPASSGSATFMMDIDGDGKTENQLKTLVQALSVSGLDLQSEISLSVAAGQLVYLVGVTAAALDKNACVGVTVQGAMPRGMGDPPPKYDGTDVFIKDGKAPAELIGTITSGNLDTKASSMLSSAEEARVDLTLAIGTGTVTLPIRGVHLQGTISNVGGQPALQNGQLNGAISEKDIDGTLIPAVAKLLTGMINSDPYSSTTKTIISLFENMANAVTKTKCMVPADCCATSPATCKILPEEIKLSPIGGVLAPDVQVFDTKDQWAPVAHGGNKNGMSLGLGFTTVPAMF